MTTGHFGSAPIDSIIVTREVRMRVDVSTDIDDLQDSIGRLGLINPIVVTRDFLLVAGERRYIACCRLGWTHIPYQFQDDISERTLLSIEFEENEKRRDFTWQERNDAIARFHELNLREDPTWTYERTAAGIGVTKQAVEQHLLVKRERAANPQVDKAEKFSVAVGTSRRIVERRAADELNTHSQPDRQYTSAIQVANFHEWASTYSGPKFNLLHCDFPYGIDHARDETYGAAHVRTGDYEDDPEIYWKLLKTFSLHLDRFCAPSAHIVFWYSPKWHSQTWELLKLLDGFQFDEFPLIWLKSDGKGIAPDPNRRPRRIYETAFFGWRGDRKILKLKNNAFAAGIDRSRHPHEKSEEMLTYFMEMIVDENTRLLDPTCGSGSALRAAKALGCKHYLGLERDEEFAREAQRALT